MAVDNDTDRMPTTPKGLDALQKLYALFLSERDNLRQSHPENGWALYGYVNGRPEREGIYKEHYIAEEKGDSCFGHGKFIVQSIQDDDGPDYAGITLIS